MEKEHEPVDPRTRAPLEKVFKKIITPIEEFIHHESTSGILLMVCAVIAILIANSVYYDSYQHILHTHFTISFGEFALDKTLHHWINDGLMALFFFLVGLEIKREVLVGELSDLRAASLPIIAAIGGMLAPALVYYSLNMEGEGVHGWGIPMATDIAFAVGAMVLLGARIPKALLTFLVALAIVDDLGAVIVIAIFYTEHLNMSALGAAAIILIIMIVFNRAGVRRTLPYALLGTLLWVAMLKSGVHATLAGVLTALTIPATARYEPGLFSKYVRGLLDKFDGAHRPGENIMKHAENSSILQTLENGVQHARTPLQRMEHGMHVPVAFLIIPIFALANAGVPIELSSFGDVLANPVAMGIILGLILGKLIGIAGFSWVAIKLGIGVLPKGVTFPQIVGMSLLAGIGFTMSIFIAELAFKGNYELLMVAKTGILFASLLAGIAGVIWLLMTTKKPT